jgi:hypothetical protein
MQRTDTVSRSTNALPFALALTLLGACSSTQAQAGDAGAAKKPASEDASREREEKLDKLRFDLEGARVELQVAELEAQAEALEAQEELDDARAELEEAERDLKRFTEVSMPHTIAEGQLGIERQIQNLGEARQELAQMEAMYASEPNLDASGQATRDMVLGRHRKRVEFGERGLELARAEFQDEVGAGLPLEQRELETKLREKRRALRKAETSLAKQALEGARALAKARRAVVEAERKLERAERGEGDEDSERGDGE